MADLDVTPSLKLNLHLLSVVGMWPASYAVIKLLSYFSVFVIFSFYLSDLALAFSVRHDMERLPICIGFVCGYFVSVFKWAWLVKHRKDIREVMTSLMECIKLGSANDTSGDWSKALQASNRTSIIVSCSWVLYILYLATQNTLYPLALNGMKVDIPPTNHSIHVVSDRAGENEDILQNKAYMLLYFLPFGDWPFVDTSHSPAYEMVYFIQGSGCIVHSVVHSSGDTFIFTLVTLACGQFEALISSLKTVGTSIKYPQLEACIKHHQQLFRTVEKINALYSPIILVEFFNMMLTLCTFAFEASKMEGGGLKIWAQAQFFLGTTIELYMICSAGSRLTSLSLQVADAIYESDWIDKPKHWKKSIMIVMMRGQKPLKLTGGPFYVISNETCLALLQLSLSYYTVLHNVQDAHE
ncbi:hypothetical protein L9F63_023077 [Diploptera punctata]|uniref:Odorant receptor n=1 Tax=Diploptera punctata TaxID=6984 RepID=A0AAD7ZKT6_DIPPU|nr:hypothetical protein L9F63_023077 [Diploptera punctata]